LIDFGRGAPREEAPRYCGRLSEIAQFRSMCRTSRSRQWLVREVPLYQVRYNNRTAHHATTHRCFRCPPGSRSNHCCERTGFQFKSELGNSDTIESSAELAQPGARCQCPARPNTFPLGRTFAGTGHRWTGLATAALGARRGARRAAFRFRIVTSPFCLSTAIGIPAGTVRLHPVVENIALALSSVLACSWVATPGPRAISIIDQHHRNRSLGAQLLDARPWSLS
jgi:hypothetical protein